MKTSQLKRSGCVFSKPLGLLLGIMLLIFILLLQACGQKGDLILPDDAAKAEQEKKKNRHLF